MISRRTFEAVLFKDDDTSGAGVRVPFDVREVFGRKGRAPVKGTIDGHPFRGSIFPYGGAPMLGVRKEIREAIGKTYGDTVLVALEADGEPRTVAVPEDLGRALAGNAAAKRAFEKMSYSHKREYVEWINEAKKAETRERRISKAVERLLEK